MQKGGKKIKRVRLLIAHDERFCREALRLVCSKERDIEIVDDVVLNDIVSGAAASAPDVIVMSIGSNWIVGIEGIQHLLEQQPPARIILIAHTFHDRLIDHLRVKGVAGFLTWDAHLDDLILAIRSVANGESITAAQDGTAPVLAAAKMRPMLTPSEALVLSLVAHGANNRTIARQLTLSEQTVANRLQVVYEKLGVNNRIQATLIALRHGWVTLDD